MYVVAHERDLAQRRSDGAERGGALWDRQSQAEKSKSNDIGLPRRRNGGQLNFFFFKKLL